MKRITSLEAQRTVSSWCSEKPALTAYFNSLNENGIAWGIFSNGANQLLADARYSTINDLDILIAEGHFKEAADATPNATVRRHFVDISSADGARLSYPADEISTTIDGVPIQIMCSPEGVNRDDEHTYEINMTQLAAEHRKGIEVDGVTVAFAHPADTVAIKAMLQRTFPKRDFDDAKRLVQWGDLQHQAYDSYLEQRTKEMHLDERAYRFLGEVGLQLAITT